MIEFRLPSLGAEMDEGTLLEWKVKPGDVVHKGDVVAVVDTSKSAIDVEIWTEGTIHELVLEPQRKVPVGTLMARLLEPGESVEHAEAEMRGLPAGVVSAGAVSAGVVSAGSPPPLLPRLLGPALPLPRRHRGSACRPRRGRGRRRSGSS